MGLEHMCPPSFFKCKETYPINIYRKSCDIWKIFTKVIKKIKSGKLIKEWIKRCKFNCKLLNREN